MKKIILKNCTVVTMKNNKLEILENRDILIRDDIIYDIGIGLVDKEAEKYNMKEKVVIPGFINCHTHVPMSIFRETLEGLTLQDWLNKKIWPAESHLTKEDVYNGAMHSFIEMIKSGTTTCNDMYVKTDAVCHAAKKCKFRLFTGHHLMDIDGNGDKHIEEERKLVEKIKETDKLHHTITLHGFYTSTPEYLEKVVKLKEDLKLPVHLHFCENKKEVEDIKRIYNVKSPVELLDRYFKDDRKILAHCVELNKQEIKDMSKMKDLSVVYNPVSNLKLGCGFANITEFNKNNINICLGTDGQGSGSNLDMFNVMKITALVNKALEKDPTNLPAEDVFKFATINGAKALGMENKLGSIEIGKKADLVVLDLNDEFVTPINNLISQIVYNASPNNVYMTIIGGDILYIKNKYLVLKDEKEILNKSEEIIKRIMK